MMKKIALGLMLVSSLGVANANSLSVLSPSSVFKFSGYNGQPASVTGTKQYGETGTLSADVKGTITFTYLGQESGYWNSLAFTQGGGTLTEAVPLGTSISREVNAGTIGFSFLDDVNNDSNVDHAFANGNTSTGAFGYVFLMDKLTTGGYDFAHSATIASGPHQGSYMFDFLLGFNDSFARNGNSRLGDSDYDDFVVGVNFTPSPVPVPAAGWLFGSALIGFISLSNRRKV